MKHHEQITDQRGNSFVPNATQARLYLAGWRLVERRKMGCVWIVRWMNPDTGEIWPQGVAFQILKES